MVDTTKLIRRPDGIDGSHWQPDKGPMNLANVRAVMTWLAWKCSQSSKGLDGSYPNIDAQAEALAFRWFLAYHWLSSTTNPITQAEHFLNNAGNWRPGKGAMLDIEEIGDDVPRCLAWFETVEDVTQRPSTGYSGLYVTGGTIWRSPEIRMSKYGPRTMVLAAYVGVENLVSRLISLGMLELAIDVWQWWSSYLMPGAITGRVDVDAVITPAMMDLTCGIVQLQPNPDPYPNPNPNPVEGEQEMNVVTNANDWDPEPDGTSRLAGHVKFAVAYRGEALYHLRPDEWKAGGSLAGIPMTNEELERLAALPMPATGNSEVIDYEKLANMVASKIIIPTPQLPSIAGTPINADILAGGKISGLLG